MHACLKLYKIGASEVGLESACLEHSQRAGCFKQEGPCYRDGGLKTFQELFVSPFRRTSMNSRHIGGPST